MHRDRPTLQLALNQLRVLHPKFRARQWHQLRSPQSSVRIDHIICRTIRLQHGQYARFLKKGPRRLHSWQCLRISIGVNLHRIQQNNLPPEFIHLWLQCIRRHVSDQHYRALHASRGSRWRPPQRCDVERPCQRRQHRPARRPSLPSGVNRERLQPHIFDSVTPELRCCPFRRPHVRRRPRKPPPIPSASSAKVLIEGPP